MPLEIEDRGPRRPPDGAIVIALLNNMPDGALEATESQFGALLGAAAGALPVRLRHAWLPEVPRGAQALERIAQHYVPVETLLAEPPDGLIVTGMEPRAASLEEEPYWNRMVQLLEWSRTRVASSIWSCLAAHAAAQASHGVRRRRLTQKLFGVFEHQARGEHPLLRGVGSTLLTPHSRWNDLPLESLRQAGCEILSSSARTGADLFVCPGPGLLVGFQGHPEYDETALLKEYRRDVGRFLRAEQAAWPTLPQDYFSASGLAALAEYRRWAEATRDPRCLADFPLEQLAAGIRAPWRTAAVAIYRNWLEQLARLKASGESARRFEL